jgi:hypothetical protein
VTPGTANAAKSTIIVLGGTTQIVSGSNITLTLQAVDEFGNLETTGGSVVAFTLGSGKDKGTFSKVSYIGNGQY